MLAYAPLSHVLMWRFLQISDPHLASEVDGIWNNNFLCTMMPDVMRCLRKDIAEDKPDFILATGDIASEQTRDATFAARDLMDSLGVPYYPMGGNHDFVLEESRDWFIQAYTAQLPVRDTVYSFTHRNLHFIVLDPWWKWSDDSLSPISEVEVARKQKKTLRGARWALPPHQFAWLENDLREHAGIPTIITMHYPAIDLPERLARPNMRYGGVLDNGGLLMETLRAFPQVKAIIAGHLHMHFIARQNGLTHVTTGAMPEFPVEYRDFHVYEDRIEVFTLGLSDPSYAARSLIPGKEWTAGQPKDRQGVISLS